MRRMKHVWIVICVSIIAISLFVTVGCSSEKIKTPKMVSKVKIGAILPLTGPMGYLGKGEQVGLTLGLKGLGDNESRIELLFDDSQGKPEVALTALRKMMEFQGVRLFVASTTPAVMALLPAVNSGTPNSLFIAQCLAPGVTKPYPFAYRIYTASDQEIELLVDYAKRSGYFKLAMLYIRNSFGEQEQSSSLRKRRPLGLG